ncbi:hypothetical protein Pla175_33190 [Pirellulimonas nuda]|uniref:DUF4350 domain-containing protein n=1 Tax=Pirellulimonas nuda TaxID=2528009 RepID=A0A518DER0_9BACT|nr:hypothetical protein [Pirellulimonas nuda]QDU89922.1 hypothetical protein Pla175_33190 [Pirellulimonas nuda]
MRSRITAGAWPLAVAALLFIGAGPCLGGGQVFNLPEQGRATALGASPTSGLKLSLDTTWVEGFGYRPVRLTLTNPTPVASPLRIALRFSARSYNNSQQTITVEQEYDFPAGAAKAEFVIDVPQYAVWNFVHWDVWVNGRHDRDLSVRLDSFAGHAVTNQALWNVLYADPDQQGYDEAPLNSAGAAMGPQQGPQQGPNIVQSIGGPLPATWRRLSCFDSVVIGFDNLVGLKDSQQAVALRRWVQAGGQLIVEGCGAEDAKRDAVAGFIRTRAAPSDAPWRALELPGPVDFDASSFYDPDSVLQQLRSAPNQSAPSDARLLDAGFGCVLALPAGFESPVWPARSRRNSGVQVSPLAAFLVQRSWVQRHGFDPARSVDEFSDWLIPGVGAAPVTLFRVLLTLFVVVIGPLNYWLLSAYGRLHLLVITVPALAALFTVGLLTYAVVADGLGARVRVRSLTMLDQQRGEAITWARMSYYAGLTPGGGLAFPESTACYPISADWDENMFGGSPAADRHVEMTPDSQRLSRGWLQARTPIQMLAVTARDAKQRISIRPSAKGLLAANALGADLQLLVARDSAGAYWMAQGCPADETVALAATTRSFAVGAIRDQTGKQAPEPPPGLDDRSFLGETASQRRRMYGGRRSYAGIDPQLSTNRMNTIISALRGADGSNTEIPPGSFVAISATSPLAPMGLQGADEQASMHVTVGEW